MNKKINAKIKLSHAPMDFVRIRAAIIKKDDKIHFRSMALFFIKDRERKKTIIRYPPRIFGEGNVPIARFEIKISLA
ncbi:hypothetical protein ACFL28_01170 [Candidatus Omnitrophota bacterium]